ncbi:hypothetical protein BMS3Abin15_01048 [bacterium BMS3Abin15]|nr:hypothetical protein BMS3Abin15_01048 [bacterium BMS3Abin15]HDZ86054.1 hypothetical protein [Candidatus Moranbacteria bacterium]
MPRTTSKEAANAATGVGIAGCIFMLLNPVTAIIGAAGIPAIIGARIFRFSMDNKEEKEIQERRNTDMDTDLIPHMHNRPLSYPFSHTPISVEPEAVLAKFRPDLAADVLKTKSSDRLLSNLANSSVATEFARQGRGTHAAVKRTKHFFGGETTEAIIRPVD